MIAKFDLKGVHTTIDLSLQKYATRKLAGLDKYLPRHHRDAAHLVVELKQATKAKEQKKYTCDVTLHLPHGTLHVAETTLNMYAAIDIVETKLKQQIKKYKESHVGSGKLSRQLTARFRRRAATELVAEDV